MNAFPAFSKTIISALCIGLLACGIAADENDPNPVLDVLTLEHAKQRALCDNPTLRAVEMRVRQAGEQVKQALASYYPSLDLEWSASHTELPGVSVRQAREGARAGFFSTLSRTLAQPGLPPLAAASMLNESALQSSLAYDSVPSSVDRYSVRLVAGNLLFTGFARKYAVAAARHGQQETEAALADAQRLLLDAIAETYHGAQLARERIHIARADTAFNRRLLEEARARQEIGATSVSEALNFEVRLRASEAQHLAAQQDMRLALLAMVALMGDDEMQLAENIALSELSPESEADMARPEYEALLEMAQTLRPDLERNRLAALRADAVVGLERSRYLPTVTAFASTDAERSGSGHFKSEDFATTLGVSVSQNLFAGGRRRAALAEARYARKEAEWRVREVEIEVAREIQEALTRLETAQQQFTLQQENAQYVARHRDMVEKEFQAGQTSLTMLNQAQRDLVEAQANYAFSRVALRSAWHTLNTATGATLANAEPDTGQ